MENIQTIDLARYTPSEIFFDKDLKQWSIPRELVKTLLGGKWPDENKSDWFNFDAVDRFLVKDYGGGEVRLVPDDGFGCPCPGPDFKLVMIPFL